MCTNITSVNLIIKINTALIGHSVNNNTQQILIYDRSFEIIRTLHQRKEH